MTKWILCLLLLIPIQMTHAQYRDHGRFIGTMINYAAYELSSSSFDNDQRFTNSFSADEKGYELFGGYRLNRFMGVELGWQSINRIRASVPLTRSLAGDINLSAQFSSYRLQFMGALPINHRIEVLAAIGQHSYKLKTSNNFDVTTSFQSSSSGSDLTHSFGFKYNVAPLIAVRLLRQSLKMGKDEVQIDALGIQIGY